MASPRYLKVSGRPVFKILGPFNFLSRQCGGNTTLALSLIRRLRATAVSAGVGNPLIGGGWIGVETSFLRHCIPCKKNISQDRLGTNIGNAEKKDTFPQERRSPCLARPGTRSTKASMWTTLGHTTPLTAPHRSASALHPAPSCPSPSWQITTMDCCGGITARTPSLGCRTLTPGGTPAQRCEKTRIVCAILYTKNDHFAKTGSGRT